jgi:hypothetical protein
MHLTCGFPSPRCRVIQFCARKVLIVYIVVTSRYQYGAIAQQDCCVAEAGGIHWASSRPSAGGGIIQLSARKRTKIAIAARDQNLAIWKDCSRVEPASGV